MPTARLREHATAEQAALDPVDGRGGRRRAVPQDEPCQEREEAAHVLGRPRGLQPLEEQPPDLPGCGARGCQARSATQAVQGPMGLVSPIAGDCAPLCRDRNSGT